MNSEKMTPDRILVIDDEDELRDFVATGLELNDFLVDQAANGEAALEMITQSDYDCVVSDIEMPILSGVELLKTITLTHEVLPVIMLTGVKNLKTAIEVMRLGAQDYLMKPINIDELVLAVRKAVEYKHLREQNRKLIKENELYQHQLENMVAKRTEQLEKAIFGSLAILAAAIEAKDQYTRGHSNRVKSISIELAKHIGISEKDMTILEYGAMLHDVGKIGVRDTVLLKDGRLSDEEYYHIMSHPSIGANIVKDIQFYEPMISCIKYHHEKYNGTGYPDKLHGDDIPLLARIISVADTYDAMTSTRPYRHALSKDKAITILKEIRGIQLDPAIVDIFVNNKIYEIDFETMSQNLTADSMGIKSFINDGVELVKPDSSNSSTVFDKMDNFLWD